MDVALAGVADVAELDVDWVWQRARLATLLADAEGTAFEQLFQQIALLRWPGTFTASIPMGSRGDLKCDGYESSAKAVFQCYGPRYRELEVREVIRKITEDFEGAFGHWAERMM